jgi:hypothetical protein
MILVILGVGLIITGVGALIYYKFYDDLPLSAEWLYGVPLVSGISISVVSLIVAIGLGVSLSGSMTIDEKIAIYQEENTKIETIVSSAVEEYKEYESGTFKDLKYNSPEILFAMYPELKSNSLVAEQMELYVNNNQIIKDLKITKLNYRLTAWWLYFGTC